MSGAMITVRLADFIEVQDLQRLVLRPSGPLPGDGPPPVGAVHIGAFDEGRAVGATTLAAADWPGPGQIPGPTWQLSRMAVHPDHQGQGIGRRVVERAVETVSSRGASTLWAMARLGALGFYTGSGWSEVGQTWIKPGAGPHRYVILACR
jgi:GNAT superfamily N-acetyltransferase